MVVAGSVGVAAADEVRVLCASASGCEVVICEKPYTKGVAAYPCGRCDPCTAKRRELWTHRVMLEAAQHSDNCFLTLTYADAKLPLTANGKMTLEPSDLRNFWKRLRLAIYPLRIRYYAVGEYGDRTERPHYHAAVFGLPTCVHGMSRFRKFADGSIRCCARCTQLQAIWEHGTIYAGSLEQSSAHYIAGYVTKKMTRTDDPRLDGRWPEFSRQSLKPGIGFSAMHEVADAILRYDLDIPTALQHGRLKRPLGRYLRAQLSKMTGVQVPQVINEEMLLLLQNSKVSAENPSLRSQITEHFKGRRINTMARKKRRKATI